MIAIPSIQQLQDDNLVLLQQALEEIDRPEMSALDVELARSNTRALAFMAAVGFHGAYQYMRDYLALQAIPIKSRGQFLRDWLAAYGMSIKQANPANGTVELSGAPGSPVAAGSDLKGASGVVYTTDVAVSIGAGGTTLVEVTALQGGVAGNVAAGETLDFVNPLAGVDGTALVVDDGIGRGTDEETEAQAAARLQQRLSNEPMGGAPHDYVRWALEVPGITRAWGLRTPGGPGTAGVIIMADGNGSQGIPTAADRQAVEDYISEPGRGPSDELFVIVPQPVLVDHVLSITPDNPEIRAAVTAELNDLYLRVAEPGVSIPHTQLTEAVSIAPGEQTHEFAQPLIVAGGEVVVGQYQIAVNHSVSFV